MEVGGSSISVRLLVKTTQVPRYQRGTALLSPVQPPGNSVRLLPQTRDRWSKQWRAMSADTGSARAAHPWLHRIIRAIKSYDETALNMRLGVHLPPWRGLYGGHPIYREERKKRKKKIILLYEYITSEILDRSGELFDIV